MQILDGNIYYKCREEGGRNTLNSVQIL